MILTNKQLQEIVDRHVKHALNEKLFGRSMFDGIKNFAKSDFVKNVGNIIGPGLGNQINDIANGKLKSFDQSLNDTMPFDAWCYNNGQDKAKLYDVNKFADFLNVNDNETKELLKSFFAYCQQNDLKPDAKKFQAFKRLKRV